MSCWSAKQRRLEWFLQFVFSERRAPRLQAWQRRQHWGCTRAVPALRRTSAALRVRGDVTKVPKSKRDAFGTCLRPPSPLPDGDKMTALGLDLNGSSTVPRLSAGAVWSRASGFILAFANGTDIKGNGLSRMGWSQTWSLETRSARGRLRSMSFSVKTPKDVSSMHQLAPSAALKLP